jgi:hypothetical protein
MAPDRPRALRSWLLFPAVPLGLLVVGGAFAVLGVLRFLDWDWFDYGLHYWRAHAGFGTPEDVVRRAIAGIWVTAALVVGVPLLLVAWVAGLVAFAQSYAREP